MEFGQSYCQDPLKRILRKFILQFSELYFIFYVFYKFTTLSENFKSENKILEKDNGMNSAGANFGTRP
jgi:hypothetical protein